jgi:hypothetical protein
MTTAGSLENQELMSQGKNLSVQCCAGPKSLPNRRKERANDREHGVSKLSREPFKFNLLNESRVFSRDRIGLSDISNNVGSVNYFFRRTSPSTQKSAFVHCVL